MNQVKSFFLHLNGYQQNKFFLSVKIWSISPFNPSCHIVFLRQIIANWHPMGWIKRPDIFSWAFRAVGFPGGSDGKESTSNEGALGLITGWEDPLEDGMATHSMILAWRIPMNRGAWWSCKVLDISEWLSTKQHVLFSELKNLHKHINNMTILLL